VVGLVSPTYSRESCLKLGNQHPTGLPSLIRPQTLVPNANSPMREMVVRTSQSFECPASAVWTLMCNSRMDDSSSLFFKLGVPQPLECRVADSQPGVGSERECVSDQGTVHQRILVWAPDKSLSFRMESTDMPFRQYVGGIVDRFELNATPRGVVVIRTTRIDTKGRFQFVTRVALYLSLKKVHRYVFQNWKRLAHAAGTSPIGLERGSPPTLAS
jgi:hypothetical protein